MSREPNWSAHLGRPDHLPVDVVVRHPMVRELGEDDIDQRRAEEFAVDLARWLFGRPRNELGPLAQVVTVVAQRELRSTRMICRDRPLMAVEAAARATAALWPWLREAHRPPEEEGGSENPEEEEGEGEGEGDEAGTSDGETDDDDGNDDDENDDDPLANLLGELGEADDPDLDALMEQLKARMSGEQDAGEEAASALADVSDAAAEGAIETDRVARQLERFLPGVGWSNAPGQLEMSLLGRLEQLSRLIEQLDELRELADALGRVEEATDRDGRRHGGREEVVGVRLGGEVATALPGELALLGDVDTEDLFYQTIARPQARVAGADGCRR